MPVAVTASGFFGKLPSRGDFVRAGLPRSFIDPWDAWLREVLPASRALLRDAWIPAWLEAPVWRFTLPPEVCGSEWVLGVWMPSVDSTGRYFPLVLARTGGDGELSDEEFLQAAEEAGRAAIADDWPPAMLRARLSGLNHGVAGPVPALPDGTVLCASDTLWWTEGSPRHPTCTLISAGLPCGAAFARMLDQPGADAHVDLLPRQRGE